MGPGRSFDPSADSSSQSRWRTSDSVPIASGSPASSGSYEKPRSRRVDGAAGVSNTYGVTGRFDPTAGAAWTFGFTTPANWSKSRGAGRFVTSGPFVSLAPVVRGHGLRREIRFDHPPDRLHHLAVQRQRRVRGFGRAGHVGDPGEDRARVRHRAVALADPRLDRDTIGEFDRGGLSGSSPKMIDVRSLKNSVSVESAHRKNFRSRAGSHLPSHVSGSPIAAISSGVIATVPTFHGIIW